ncbi:sporulation integral membrane protein YtvI [Oceanobacillus chungangensis]|uniref:Sporulation integral membrane protein YtvI n=1 Tax=Oceanobacillus chungangensis TaxID=1229152 RepID=A0A3D8PZI3_9BACI|nr:sporulation integral membrane protein YtvI [Oceanobacillus chungangensis]RDW21586.1 sporulation integral membrane protein YtvI [Oceanobacillus chungangensis]
MYKPLLMQLLRLIIVIAIMICGYFIIKYTFIYLYPLFIAVLLASLLHPIVHFIESIIPMPRAFATFITIIFIFLFLFGTIYFIIIEIYQGTAFLAEKLPAYFQAFLLYIEALFNQSIVPIYEKVLSLFQTLGHSQQQTIEQNVNKLTVEFATSGAELLQNLFSSIPRLLSFVPDSITVFIFTILATFLITNDWERLKQGLKTILPQVANTSTKKILSHLKGSLLGFIKAQLILVITTSALILIGLLILRVEHAVTIALLAAFVDIIPFIGTGMIFIPWMLYLFLTANYSLTIGITIIYMVTIVLRQLIEPKVLSSNMGIHPLVALLGYFLALQFWGIGGFLVAPLLLIVLHAFYHAGVFHSIGAFIKGST